MRLTSSLVAVQGLRNVLSIRSRSRSAATLVRTISRWVGMELACFGLRNRRIIVRKKSYTASRNRNVVSDAFSMTQHAPSCLRKRVNLRPLMTKRDASLSMQKQIGCCDSKQSPSTLVGVGVPFMTIDGLLNEVVRSSGSILRRSAKISANLVNEGQRLLLWKFAEMQCCEWLWNSHRRCRCSITCTSHRGRSIPLPLHPWSSEHSL